MSLVGVDARTFMEGCGVLVPSILDTGVATPATSDTLSRDFEDWLPFTDLSKSEKSAPPIEKRMGGNAGAMNVAWEVCSIGDDSCDSSDTSSPSGSPTSEVLSAGSNLSSGGRVPTFGPLPSLGGGNGGRSDADGSSSWYACKIDSSVSASVSVPLSTLRGTSTRWPGDVGRELLLELAGISMVWDREVGRLLNVGVPERDLSSNDF